jgi:ankyrin repeat protein
VAIKPLLQNGERIDQLDNERMTALAYALQGRDSAAALRLILLGARADAPVGVQEMPAALIPVMTKDLESIRALRKSGVDYSKLRYRNMTAIDYAKQVGDDELINALKRNSRSDLTT